VKYWSGGVIGNPLPTQYSITPTLQYSNLRITGANHV
jgi:hypothetical protein